MNILLFSDLHITKESLEECREILREIVNLCIEYKINKIINLGDTFDSYKPGSAELDLFSQFIVDCGKPIVLIAADSHESTTHEESILNHLGMLNNSIRIVKSYEDGEHLFCGHFSIKESPKNYDAKLSLKDLKKYKHVYLGHIHSFYQKEHITGIGSCRFVSFDEANDTKGIILITDYKGVNEKHTFIPLKSPIPMVQLDLCKKKENKLDSWDQAQKKVPKKGFFAQNSSNFEALCQYLDKLKPKTKVKVLIHDFKNYHNFLDVEDKYKQKFIKFVRENRFELFNSTPLFGEEKDTKNLQESFEAYSKEKEINAEISSIILNEIK